MAGGPRAQIGTVRPGLRLEVACFKKLQLRKPGQTGSKKVAKKVRFLLDAKQKSRSPDNQPLPRRKAKGTRASVRSCAKAKHSRVRRQLQGAISKASGRNRRRRWDGSPTVPLRIRSMRNQVPPSMVMAIGRGDNLAVVQLLSRLKLSMQQRHRVLELVTLMYAQQHLETMSRLGLAPSSEASVTLVGIYADGRPPRGGELRAFTDVEMEWASVSAAGVRTVTATQKGPLSSFGSWDPHDLSRLRIIAGCVDGALPFPDASGAGCSPPLPAQR